VVIGADCIGSYKSNYHTITITKSRRAKLKVIISILKLIFLVYIILHCSYFYILVFSNVILCENISGYISCTYPSRIYVSEAIYGRTADKSICPSWSIKTTHCKSSTSDRKVKALCNGKRLCRLKADHRSYGNPCRGTHKYLEVKYKCA
jgi:hypothetical protein